MTARTPLVVVVGSINVDYVIRVPRRPAPGETVGDGTLEVHAGGKGSNQAVAAARSGAAVEMVGCVGQDAAGRSRIDDLTAEGVGTSHVRLSKDTVTGSAFITVTPDGENAIVTAAGANAMLATEDVDRAATLISSAAVLVAQLEVPVTTVTRAAQRAGPTTLVVLNCAPYHPLPAVLLERVDVLVANENEAAAIVGERSEGTQGARRAGISLLAHGPRSVLITLGPLGALVITRGKERRVPAPTVQAVDTTGAGDAFVGVLAAHLGAGATLSNAAKFGSIAGSATTEQRGASPVVPVNARLTTGGSSLQQVN